MSIECYVEYVYGELCDLMYCTHDHGSSNELSTKEHAAPDVDISHERETNMHDQESDIDTNAKLVNKA